MLICGLLLMHKLLNLTSLQYNNAGSEMQLVCVNYMYHNRELT